MRQGIWIRKCASFAEEEEADREFWQEMTGEERVAVLEDMRREFGRANGEPDERLRRVVRIIESPWS